MSRNSSVPQFAEYVPGPKQDLFHGLRYISDVYAFFGAWRSGKSLSGCREVTEHCMTYPGAEALIGRSTFADLRATTLPMFLDFTPDSIIADYNKSEHLLTYVNGSRVRFTGFDRFRKFGSLNLSFVWIEEAADGVAKRIFEALNGRLSLAHVGERKIFLTSNNDTRACWLYEDFVQGAIPHPTEPDVLINPKNGFASVQVATLENLKHLPPAYIENCRKSLTKEMFEIYILGQWGTLEQGRCYYAFDPVLNATESDYIPAFEIHWTLDYNINPMTSLIIQEHPVSGDVESHVIDEIVLKDADTHKVCDEFIKRYGNADNRRVRLYGDSSARSRDTRSRTTDLQIIEDRLKSAGFNVIENVPKHNPSVRNRINVVNGRFLNANGDRRAFIHPKCRAAQTDLLEVAYKPGTAEKDKTNPNLTHASDALDYYVWERLRPQRYAQTL